MNFVKANVGNTLRTQKIFKRKNFGTLIPFHQFFPRKLLAEERHRRKGRRQLNISTDFIWKDSLGRVSAERELELTAKNRLGIDIEGAGGKVPGRSLGGKFFLWVTKVYCCWGTKEDKCG
jgi:hypothetical protein